MCGTHRENKSEKKRGNTEFRENKNEKPGRGKKRIPIPPRQKKKKPTQND